MREPRLTKASILGGQTVHRAERAGWTWAHTLSALIGLAMLAAAAWAVRS
jgi:hypothetical protein